MRRPAPKQPDAVVSGLAANQTGSGPHARRSPVTNFEPQPPGHTEAAGVSGCIPGQCR
ncbi:hypothetical protein ARTHRO9V_210295 [Arthrobacter sp. 9V]|nr:hypothetical protein ARTHRO9V_210295 [Arthrobacter sp. 9V]